MSITTVIDSVTTGDAAPTTAPHKLSHNATKNGATILFTPTNSTGQKITGFRIEEGGTAPGSGTFIDQRGFPCSDTLPEAKCSDSLNRALCTDGINSNSGTQLSRNVADSQLSSGDGAKNLKVYVCALDTALS